LQNVAVISSMQKTPVVGPWLGAGLGAGVGADSTPCSVPWAADCDWPLDVARCATAGEAGNTAMTAKADKTSAAISVSLFISTIRFGPTLRCVPAKIVATRKPSAPLFVPRVSS
jgi:hypothetical protein